MSNLSSPEAIAAVISGAFAVFNLVVGVFIWIYKSKIKAKMDKELDDHKIELQSFFDAQIERLRVEYKTLYERRVESVEKLYSLLIDIQEKRRCIADHLDACKAGGTYPRQMKTYVDELNGILSQFKSLFIQSKIYFPKDTIVAINQIISSINGFKGKYAWYKEEGGQSIEEFMNSSYSTIFPDNFDDIILCLENNFRSLMGEKQ